MPFGRQQIEKHPGSVILPADDSPLLNDSYLAQRFSRFNINDGVCEVSVIILLKH